MTDETRLGEEKFKELKPLLDQAATMVELRMQRMLPGQHPEGYYKAHDEEFYDYFLDLPGCEATILDRCAVIGDPRYLEAVGALVNQRLVEIQTLTGVEIPKIVIFLSDGKTMLHKYSYGSSQTGMILTPPFAWGGGGSLTCYINTDRIDEYGISSPASVRAIMHEPTHSGLDFSLIGSDGYPTWVLDNNWLISEALAGPNDPSFWEDLQPPEGVELDFGPLEKGELGFYDWLDKIIEDYKIEVPYFQNWAVAEFYRWAAKQGDMAYWYQKALELKP